MNELNLIGWLLRGTDWSVLKTINISTVRTTNEKKFLFEWLPNWNPNMYNWYYSLINSTLQLFYINLFKQLNDNDNLGHAE